MKIKINKYAATKGIKESGFQIGYVTSDKLMIIWKCLVQYVHPKLTQLNHDFWDFLGYGVVAMRGGCGPIGGSGYTHPQVKFEHDNIFPD